MSINLFDIKSLRVNKYYIDIPERIRNWDKMTLSSMLHLICALVSVLVAFLSWSYVSDFSVSVNPILADAHQGNITHVKVEVIPGWLYNKDVSLRSETTSSGIYVQFKPQLI